MEKLYKATMNKEPFDPKQVDLKPNTYAKVLTTLEDLEFVVRKNQDINLLPKGIEFASIPQRRAMLLAESALKIEAFSVFISILEIHRTKPKSSILALELKDRLGADWKDKTAKVYVGILLDWAQHTNLAPHLFNSSQLRTFSFNDDGPTTLWS